MAELTIEPVDIRGRLVGPGQPVFVIAEAGVNHDGDLDRALQLVDAAAEAGADAVKFQTFSADRLVTRDAPQAEYQARGMGRKTSQHAMLMRLELSEEDHFKLSKQCEKKDVMFLSSPFDERSADLLKTFDVPAFKIGSGELTNLPLLEHVARIKKPMIVSTGMANLDEVGDAVKAIRAAGNRYLVLLHCVSCYPSYAEDVNLRAMGTLAEAFGVPVGYSDHTTKPLAIFAAVARGASIIEKHFTTDRSLRGPDHQVSCNPKELAELIDSLREIERMLGHGRKEPVDREREIAHVARKSLVAAVDITAGTEIEDEMITVLRPGYGLPPARRGDVVGCSAGVDIPAGTPITEEMLG